MEGETRTVTYDKVALYNGADGYSKVDPNGGDLPSGAKSNVDNKGSTSSVVQIKKRNASGFAMDGDNNGVNGQNIYLWLQNAVNINRNWIEIDRGNDYYSYQKKVLIFALTVIEAALIIKMCIYGHAATITKTNIGKK